MAKFPNLELKLKPRVIWRHVVCVELLAKLSTAPELMHVTTIKMCSVQSMFVQPYYEWLVRHRRVPHPFRHETQSPQTQWLLGTK